jgi:Ca2+-binding RTX toxin-like protein
MAELRIGTSRDYSRLFLFDIDTIVFTDRAEATFSGTQFNDNQISTSLAVEGSPGRNVIVVNSGLSGFDASAWTFRGWQHEDRIIVNGSSFAETIRGSVENDILFGNGGSDTVAGRAGNDIVSGGSGADTLKGGGGRDWVSYGGSAAAVNVNLANDTAWGGDASGDSISDFENVRGGNGDDTLAGSAVANRIEGGLGADQLTGGAAADRFVYKSVLDSTTGFDRDRITDFSQSQNDRIDLSSIDAVSSTLRHESFRFVENGPLLAAGDLRYQKMGTYTLIEGDTDGDHLPDFQIVLSGAITLDRLDFIL